MENITSVRYCEIMREELLVLEDKARNFLSTMRATDNIENIEQATLSLRHIEDARMRYWKSIQYLSDGISIYNK